MRINRFIARASGLSRRGADQAITDGRVRINGQVPASGQEVTSADTVTLDGVLLRSQTTQTIMLNKPVGYVTSRQGQGSKTLYELLPPELHILKPVGRLDKGSSGLLLLTNDGELAQQLTHPRYQKTKIYEIRLDRPLQPLHRQMLSERGVQLDDGPSRLQLERLREGDERRWRVIMHEGRNRQIRRTFGALGYTVTQLHRTQFGMHKLGSLKSGDYRPVGSTTSATR